MIEIVIYIAIGIIAIGYFFGALYWGFSTPMRAAISIIFLILLFATFFKITHGIPDLNSMITFLLIAVIVLYNLKELGIIAIIVLSFLGNNHDESSKVKILTAEELLKKKNLDQNHSCEYYYIDTIALNLRKAPNIKSARIGTITQNTKVCVSKQEEYWAYVSDKGWVYNKYLKRTK